jgi:hypothetical protein
METQKNDRLELGPGSGGDGFIGMGRSTALNHFNMRPIRGQTLKPYWER